MVDDRQHDRTAVGSMVADTSDHGNRRRQYGTGHNAGMTRMGSAAAKGIAPSVMPIIPIAMAASPASRSSIDSKGSFVAALPAPSPAAECIWRLRKLP